MNYSRSALVSYFSPVDCSKVAKYSKLAAVWDVTPDVTTVIRDAEKIYYAENFEMAKGNIRKTWLTINI